MEDVIGLKDETTSTDVDNLIKAALGSSKDKKEDRYVTQIKNFIRSKKIVAGDVRVPQYVVYKVYKETVDNYLHKNSFSRIFRQFFEPRVYKNVIYYMLTTEPFDLPDDYRMYVHLMKRRKIHGRKKRQEAKDTKK